MTTALLITDLQADEGLRLTAYQDSVGVTTVGYGHTPATPGETWTQAQAEQALISDIATACAGLDNAIPWWRDLDDARQDVLAEMAFNLGVAGLLGFHHFLADARAGNYALASAAMLISLWADEVGDRAQRLAIMMKDGTR